jgi:hypothetical protein
LYAEEYAEAVSKAAGKVVFYAAGRLFFKADRWLKLVQQNNFACKKFVCRTGI